MSEPLLKPHCESRGANEMVNENIMNSVKWDDPNLRSKIVERAHQLWESENAEHSWTEESRDHYIIRASLEHAMKVLWPHTKFVPEGWALVPIEPTSEMLQSARHQSSFGSIPTDSAVALEVWENMLDEAKNTVWLPGGVEVPVGWALVPYEPTEGMMRAAKYWGKTGPIHADNVVSYGVYTSMLAARPKLPWGV